MRQDRIPQYSNQVLNLTEKETIPELPRKARLSKMDEFYEHFVRFVESETATVFKAPDASTAVS